MRLDLTERRGDSLRIVGIMLANGLTLAFEATTYADHNHGEDTTRPHTFVLSIDTKHDRVERVRLSPGQVDTLVSHLQELRLQQRMNLHFAEAEADDVTRLSCPTCGSDGVSVLVSTMARTTPDGMEQYGDMEFDGDNLALCDACGHDGVVSDFEPLSLEAAWRDLTAALNRVVKTRDRLRPIVGDVDCMTVDELLGLNLSEIAHEIERRSRDA